MPRAEGALPVIDAPLLAQLDRILHPEVGNLVTAITIYHVAHDCYLRSLDAKWLTRFDEAERQIRAFVEQAQTQLVTPGDAPKA